MGGELVHRTIQTNGINMHIAEQGEGPLVLLLHGFPELWFSWRKQITELANHGYHVVAPDLRGFGDTDCPPDFTSYTACHLVGDIIGLLDQLCEKQAFVVGHDWGAFVAWCLCLFRPDRVRALVNLCVPVVPRSPEKPTDILGELYGEGFYMLQFQVPSQLLCRTLTLHFFEIPFALAATYLEPGRAEKSFASYDCLTVMKKFLLINKADMLIAPSGKEIIDTLDFPSLLPPWITEEELQYFASKFEKSGFTGGLNYYRVVDLNWQLLAPWEGAKITVPTKFIAAAKDIGFDAYKIKDYALGGAMKNVVPDLEVAIIDGCHFIQQEKAQEVNDEILSFFGKLSVQKEI